MTKNQLLIFVKNLIPGTVKTRLAEDIGMQGAMDVYQYLVEYTYEETKDLMCDKAVYYSEYVEMEDIFDDGDFEVQVQKGGDLGERMQNAFVKGFEAGWDKLVIIGSDSFELKKKHIEEAFEQLDEHDVVIGPAKDGGYYLLGMKTTHERLFADKKYGHDKVLNELLTEVASLDLSFHLLPELNDIDTLQDLKDSDIDFEFVDDGE